MRRVGSGGRRGFSMLIIAIVMALLSIGAAALLDLVKLDIGLSGSTREGEGARDVAEGGLYETLADLRTPSILPTLDTPGMSAVVTPPTSSPFNSYADGKKYDASIEYLRAVPMGESSHTHARALTYEVRVSGSSAKGASGLDVVAEVYTTVWLRPGTILPRRHAR